MTQQRDGGGKLPGKTEYAGRRRSMTRSSGFSVHPDTTGGEFRRAVVKSYRLKPGQCVEVTFRISGHAPGHLLGYGTWFWHKGEVSCAIVGGFEKRTVTSYDDKSWNKVGSIWAAHDNKPVQVTVAFTATTAADVALYEPVCGRIQHRHLQSARPELLRNMYQFAPEAVFVDETAGGELGIQLPDGAPASSQEIIIKSCNRCGRYLPVNVRTERDQLSFSNHCVAQHRRPCKHSTFGRLRNPDRADDQLRLDYGFQLECRFCKKFEVNAAHNPQRTTAQMKEDGARRRAFELLLAELYGGTPQLRYRHEHGAELADEVWRRFQGKCFNCGADLPSARDMFLDHTRPLALLWPLDRTATALCGPCNSQKRDRPPAEFYSERQLVDLAVRVGLSAQELTCGRPNEDALELLLERREWFFGEFLTREEMVKERDGKVAGELVVKALQKVLVRCPHHRDVDLIAEYDQRRRGYRKP